MKIWIYVEQAEDWEMVAECPDRWTYWVTNSIRRDHPTLQVEYGTDKPKKPLTTSLHNR